MATLIPTCISDVIAIAESHGYTLVKNGRKVDVTYPNSNKIYSYSGSIVAVALRLGIIDQDDADHITKKDDRHLKPTKDQNDQLREPDTTEWIARLEARIPTLKEGGQLWLAQTKKLAELKAKLS